MFDVDRENPRQMPPDQFESVLNSWTYMHLLGPEEFTRVFESHLAWQNECGRLRQVIRTIYMILDRERDNPEYSHLYPIYREAKEYLTSIGEG